MLFSILPLICQGQPEFYLYGRLATFWNPDQWLLEPVQPNGYLCIICNSSDDEWSCLSYCGHHYHTKCITAWLEMLENKYGHPYCPLCCEGDDAVPIAPSD